MARYCAGMDTGALRSLAAALGFDGCRVARADAPWAAGARLEAFVAAGRHGQMDWMETTLARRAAPTAMWADARSAVVVGLNYGPSHDPLDTLERRESGNISVYARGKDYHDVLKKRLKQLARAFAEETGEAVKVFVDTAPLMEKPLAERAGLGWQGKHTNLVSRDLGNWLFLGVMLTSAVLEPDAPGDDHCGSCRACLDVCPTDAFPAPYQLDARRCISYLTIELKGPIPRQFRPLIGNRIYGCDDCLAVCPWNKFARKSDPRYAPRGEPAPRLAELAGLDDATFRSRFAGSPIKRIGRGRFLRNVAVAVGNSGDAALSSTADQLASDADPLVRGHGVWALARLDPDRIRQRYQCEDPDPFVAQEWRHACAEAQ